VPLGGALIREHVDVCVPVTVAATIVPLTGTMPEPSKLNVELNELPCTVADPEVYVSVIPCSVVQVCPELKVPVDPSLVKETLQLDPPPSFSLLAVSFPLAPVMFMIDVCITFCMGTPAGDVNVTAS
jgi:hypothetical protein